MESGINTLIVLVGPTASGKTEVSINLAKWLSTEIISADARQFYREMSIGTAKPSPEQLKEVSHHFIGHISIHDRYDIAAFEKEALERIEYFFRSHKIVIMTGGSGLYIDAVCKGIDVMPGHDPELRKGLELSFKNHGIDFLRQELAQLDPEYLKKVDQQNPVRLIRAIEVCLLSGKPYTSFRKGQPQPRPFNILKIGLNIQRELLISRINQRIDGMIVSGLVEEARPLFPFRNLQALNTVGYKELFNYFDGACTLDEAVEEIRKNTRRYAKRQMTWFRKDTGIAWFDSGKLELIKRHISRHFGYD